MSNSLQTHWLYPTRLLLSWNFPGKSTGVGCHFLLQRMFPTQVSHIAGRGFTLWATKEAYLHTRQSINSILSLAITNPFPNLWPGKKKQGRKLFSGLNWNLLHFLVLDKSKFHSHYHIIFIISIISKTCPPPPPPPPKNIALKVIHYSKQYIIRERS